MKTMKKRLTAVLASVITISLIASTACKKKEKRSNPDVAVGKDYFPEITFTIQDMDGNSIDESVFSLHKLTMINFWEPWCGPCINEMPDLQKLYKDYEQQGFYIIGVYSSTDMKDDVKNIIKNAGITYPIATYDSAFDRFHTGVVPTTIFVDEHGWILPLAASDQDKMFVGAGTYEEWAGLIGTYLLYEDREDAAA